MTEDNGEGTLGVLSGECIGIYGRSVQLSHLTDRSPPRQIEIRTRVADTSVEDLDTDLVGLRRSDLDIFDGKWLASFPGDGGLSRV